MKKFIWLLLLFFSALIIQQRLPQWGLFGGLKPPLFTSVMIYASFRLKDKNAWIVSIASAFLYDSLEPGPYGPALLSFPILTLLIIRFRKNLFHEGLITQIFCGAISGLITIIFSIFIYLITDARPLDFIFIRVVGSMILGAISLPLCSKLFLDIIPSEERGGHV